MNEIKVKKQNLLEVLEKNKEEHRNLFEKAVAGYREKAIYQLDVAIKEAKDGKKIRTYFNITQPEDHTQDYEETIGMLKMSIDTEILLSRTEYRHYVEDNWSWKDAFEMCASGCIDVTTYGDM